MANRENCLQFCLSGVLHGGFASPSPEGCLPPLQHAPRLLICRQKSCIFDTIVASRPLALSFLIVCLIVFEFSTTLHSAGLSCGESGQPFTKLQLRRSFMAPIMKRPGKFTKICSNSCDWSMPLPRLGFCNPTDEKVMACCIS